MASCYGYIYIHIMLMLQWYNCTGIYIAKYRQSIAFSSIYIGGHFSWLSWGRKPYKTQKVAQVTVCRHSEHHAVFIGCPHCCLRQGTGVMLTFGNAPHRIAQHVRFGTSRLSTFATLPRTMNRCIAWWGHELSIPRFVSYATRRKTYKQLLSQAACAVCTRMKSLLPWLNICYLVPATYVCACHCSLNCVYA